MKSSQQKENEERQRQRERKKELLPDGFDRSTRRKRICECVFTIQIEKNTSNEKLQTRRKSMRRKISTFQNNM
jgi:hypothetical protein